MWVILFDEIMEIGKRVWPSIPEVGHSVRYKSVRYRVTEVEHDMDTRDEINVYLERI